MRYLADELKGYLATESLFDDACLLEGKIYRELEGRRTLRFEIENKGYFVKLHFGVGWKEIIKNLFQFKVPVLGAKNEWMAVNRLRELGISTLTPVAYANEGGNPATKRSCLITKALDNTMSLEDLALESSISLSLRRQLNIELAGIARVMHNKGINHRDFYLCHFLLDMNCVTLVNEKYVHNRSVSLNLYLIDLHRAQMRARTPKRWQIKDLSGLLFSAVDSGIKRNDLFRFIKVYTGKSLREVFSTDQAFWLAVNHKAKKLYLKDHGKESVFLSQKL
ncbi:MAG: heptose I phosphotransferase [Candidatus Azotimanducaceae bacterium]|jgi:heptose I phosphotransferase